MKPYRINIYRQSFDPDVYRWKITAPNGRIINHEYNDKSGCRRSLNAFLTAIRTGNYIIENEPVKATMA